MKEIDKLQKIKSNKFQVQGMAVRKLNFKKTSKSGSPSRFANESTRQSVLSPNGQMKERLKIKFTQPEQNSIMIMQNILVN